jgi:hypothetical protein
MSPDIAKWLEGENQDFVIATERLVERFKSIHDPVSNKKVNQLLTRLRNTLDALPPDVVELLERRELSALIWDTEEEDADAQHRVRTGKSAVKLLRQLADVNINKGPLPDHWYRHDARLRLQLVQAAAQTLEAHGIELDAGLRGPFVEYLTRLGKDLGWSDEFDATKAASSYLDPNQVMKKLTGAK